MNERNQGGRRGRTGQQMEERPLPPRQTPAQRRAQEAWAWVELAKRLDKTNKDRYLTLARKLSGYLQVSGFEQTMAFLFSKAKQSRQTPEGLLFMQLGEYVGRELDQTLPPNAPLSNIMSALLALSNADSMRAAHEALAISEWLRRFAPGELEEAKK